MNLPSTPTSAAGEAGGDGSLAVAAAVAAAHEIAFASIPAETRNHRQDQ